MHRPDYRYLVLWLFLFGIIVIVFLQVVSGYNIKRLTQGNKSLLNELQVQNTLRKMETDLLTAESDVRGAVITGNRGYVKNISVNHRQIDKELVNLEEFMSPKKHLPLFDQLKL